MSVELCGVCVGGCELTVLATIRELVSLVLKGIRLSPLPSSMVLDTAIAIVAVTVLLTVVVLWLLEAVELRLGELNEVMLVFMLPV